MSSDHVSTSSRHTSDMTSHMNGLVSAVIAYVGLRVRDVGAHEGR